MIPSFGRQTKEKLYTSEQPAEQSVPKCNGDPQGETLSNRSKSIVLLLAYYCVFPARTSGRVFYCPDQSCHYRREFGMGVGMGWKKSWQDFLDVGNANTNLYHSGFGMGVGKYSSKGLKIPSGLSGCRKREYQFCISGYRATKSKVGLYVSFNSLFIGLLSEVWGSVNIPVSL